MALLVLPIVLGGVLWLGYVVLNGVERLTRQDNMVEDEKERKMK